MPTENIEKVFNKCRMSCVAAVESLSALGVYDFPVFGFAMGGARAWVLMAWKSTNVVEPEKRAGPLAQATANTYIMDHNLTSFDISLLHSIASTSIDRRFGIACSYEIRRA